MRFLVGVNYWPRSSAIHMWSRFDLGEIDEDLARIAGMGLQVVRFFLTWEVFQPTPFSVDAGAVRNFLALLERIGAHGLRAMPTLFCGHMSGVNLLPEWTLDRTRPNGRFRTLSRGKIVPYGAGDIYGAELLEPQRQFVRTIGRRARAHGAILAWDLGNEFSNLRAPATPEAGGHWSAALAHDLYEASNIGVTAGTHGEDLTEDRNIRPSLLCEPLAFATMHGYPAYSAFARAPDDAEVVPFLFELTAAFSAKRVFFSEFGAPLSSLDEEPAARYAAAVLPRLAALGALGALWWNWTDYAPELAATPPFDSAPHEMHFGLLRADGSERPVARVLSEFAREQRAVTESTNLEADEAAYYAALPEATREAYAEYVIRAASAEERG